MTRIEHLLTIMAEECSEVAQRISKALRFGLEEVQPGQEKTNAERINDEINDLMTLHQMLHDAGLLKRVGSSEWRTAFEAKRQKVEKYLAFSAGRGLVDVVSADPTVQHPEAKQPRGQNHCFQCDGDRTQCECRSKD